MKALYRKTAALLMVVLFLGMFAMSSVSAKTVTVKGGTNKGDAITLKANGTKYVYNLKSTQKLTWFKFKSNSNYAYYDWNADGIDGLSKDVEFIFRRANNAVILKQKGKDARCTANLKPDSWYYLVVKNNSKAKGKINLSITTAKDEDRNTKGSAVTLSNARNYSGTMANDDDVDFYKFVPTETGKYRVTVKQTSGGYLEASFLTKDGSRLARESLEGKGEALTGTHTLKKGSTYYIRVKNELDMGWDFPEYSKKYGNYKVRIQKK